MDKNDIGKTLFEIHREEYKERVFLLKDHKEKYRLMRENIMKLCDEDGGHKYVEKSEERLFGFITVFVCQWCNYKRKEVENNEANI